MKNSQQYTIGFSLSHFAMKNSIFAFLVALFASTSVSFSLDTRGFEKKSVFTVSAAGQTAIGENTYSGAPVLLRISPETVPGFSYDIVKSDGLDIAFTDSAGTVLPHEIDTWDPKGTSFVWVRLPEVTASTTFNFYFGNGISTPDVSGETWNGYVGVWHLNETNQTDTANSFGVYPNSTSTAGIDGNLAFCSQANAEGFIGKSVLINDSGYKTGNYCYGGVWVPGTDALKMGSTFTISGWFKHGTYQIYYDHMLYKRTRADNTTTKGGPFVNPLTGSFAIEHGAQSGKTVKPAVRGASGAAKTFTLGNPHDEWDWIVFVYDGTSVTVYENGVSKGTQTGIVAVTDNDAPLVFGNNTEVAFGGMGDCAWGGWIDEVRLVDDVLDANRIQGEYLLMTNTGLFESSEAVLQDTTALTWGDATSVVWDGAEWRISATAKKGEGTVSVIVKDVETGVETEAISSVSFTNGGSLDGVALPLPGTGLYSVSVKGVSTGGTETKSTFEHLIYNGTISAELISNADEISMSAGVIRLSVPSALAQDLSIPVTVTGTAVAGQTYREIPPSVVLPAGQTSVDVEIVPIYCSDVTEDVTVTLTVRNANVMGGATATATIVNASVDTATIYVSPSGNDENSGYSLGDAKATISAALAAADPTISSTIWMAAGTYAQTETILVASPVTIRSISGNPEDVTISKASGNFSIVTLNHAEAKLLDLTVSGGGGAKVSGGNVYIDAAGGVVEHCVLESGNTATFNYNGGNVSMKAGVVTRCILKNGIANYAGGGGGAYLSGGRIESCLVYGNYAGAENADTTSGDNGGGIRLNGTSAEAVNCTVFLNRGAKSPGIYIDKGRAVNCVIVDNFTMDGNWNWSNVGGKTSTGSQFVSCMTDGRLGQPSSSCYGAPFGFADRIGRDYRLTAASAAVDAGEEVTFYSNLDLDGNPRISGTAVDAGCFELQQTGPMIGLAAMDEEVLVGQEVEFVAATFGGDVTGSYVWDFGDGSEPVSTETPSATHVYTVGATNAVTVTATVGGTEVSYTVSRSVVSCPVDLYVDAANTAGAAYPYATPETAATKVTDALSAATDGSTIHIADGTYPISSTILLNKQIVLEGIGGIPANVVLTASNARRTLWISNEGAVVRNLTLSNGKSTQSNGGNLKISQWGGFVSNCVITAGFGDNYSGNGGNIYMNAGHVTHSVISDGKLNNTGGGNKGVNVSISGGLLEHSLITGGSDATDGSSTNVAAGVYISGGTLRNCTIAKNAGLTTGGVFASGGSIVNTVIAGNTSANKGGDYVAWAGNPELFVNCVTDTETALNDTCLASNFDMLFADYANGDFHLAAGAVAIDAGAAIENPPAHDLDGAERVQGNGIDMGCYEYDTASLAVSFASSASEGIAPMEITFTASLSGVDSLDTVNYGWDFDGDGVVDRTTQVPETTYVYETPGWYSIGLYVTDVTLGIEASLVKQDSLHIVSPILYVDAASTSPALPYDTRENAATDLQDAVDEAIDGCMILIAPGYYEHGKTYAVHKSVAIMGESGRPDDVLLVSKNAGGIHLNGEKLLLANVTITNGYSGGGTDAGVYFGAAGGSVSNCAIRSCKAIAYSGNGSAVNSSLSDNVLVTHTIIDGCIVSHGSGGGSKYVVYLRKGRIENSLIRNCKGILIETETQTHAGVLSVGSTSSLVNCTIVDNEAAQNCFLEVTDGGRIVNTVFANNSMPDKDSADPTHTGFSSSENLGAALQNCVIEEGVLTEAPNETVAFGDVGSFFKDWQARNLVPDIHGPLFNKGADVVAPATDLAGTERVLHSRIDIGAYENAKTPGFYTIFR